MKISFNWLKQYIALDISAEKTAEILTGCGLEVESIEKHETVKGGLSGCIIGEVKTKEKHSDADRLSVCTVDIGKETLLNIVCGADNVAGGQKVVVATAGSILFPPKGESITIKKTKIRGVISEGMICAEDEIGVGGPPCETALAERGESHLGIMVLDDSAAIGTPAKDYFSARGKYEEDYIFEIGLTPNRSDAASHIGVAKDLFAVLNWSHPENKYELNIPEINPEGFENSQGLEKKIEITVEDTVSCPHYSGITISGVTVSESPGWLKKRLQATGLKPINNIVDITNFVLHETGQPLHAFDADKISGGKIIVKKLSEPQQFVTLDGVERTLTKNDLMICNAQKPMCIAGVMGGMESGITDETKNIFLESACFLPFSIHKTSKKHNLRTDSSFRFERGTDPNITVYALQRTASLIKEIAGGTFSEITDIYPSPIKEKKVSFSFYGCNRLIGKTIEHDTIKRIITLLGMEIISEGPDALLVEVPTDKTDIEGEEDIVEEILRIYGCNNIEIPSSVHASLSIVSKPDTWELQNIISDLLCGTGFSEIMSNSFTDSRLMDLLPAEPVRPGHPGGKEKVVELINPLSPELNILRPTLLFSGLEAITYNQNRKKNDLKLFEFGKIYKRDEGKGARDELKNIKEENHLALFLCGKRQSESWNSSAMNVDFFYLKSCVNNVLKRLGIEKKIEEIGEYGDTKASIFSSGVSYRFRKKNIIEFGIVKKSILKKFTVKQEVLFADFNWDELMELIKNYSICYKPIPRFPEVRRDLALIVDKKIKYELMESLAFNTEKELLKEVNLFDVYEGEKIGAGKKSYALSFILQNENTTLTDSEVEQVMQKLLKVYQEKAGAVIRS